MNYYIFILFNQLPVRIYTLTAASESLPMDLIHMQADYWHMVALVNTETTSVRRFFYLRIYFNIISSVDLGVRESGHGKLTRSITTNHPCLMTSVELDCSWEGFSAFEKIPRSGVCVCVCGWNKAAELLWTVWFGRTGLCLSCSWNHCLTASWAERNPSMTKAGGGGIWWPPLWEYCKLCFPKALGTPQRSLTLTWRHGKRGLGPWGCVWGGGAASLHCGWAGDPRLARDQTGITSLIPRNPEDDDVVLSIKTCSFVFHDTRQILLLLQYLAEFFIALLCRQWF